MVELSDGVRTARLPIRIVRRQPAVDLAKSCSPTSLAINASTTCTITMANTDPEDAPVNMIDENGRSTGRRPGVLHGAGYSA